MCIFVTLRPDCRCPCQWVAQLFMSCCVIATHSLRYDARGSCLDSCGWPAMDSRPTLLYLPAEFPGHHCRACLSHVYKPAVHLGKPRRLPITLALGITWQHNQQKNLLPQLCVIGQLTVGLLVQDRKDLETEHAELKRKFAAEREHKVQHTAGYAVFFVVAGQ